MFPPCCQDQHLCVQGVSPCCVGQDGSVSSLLTEPAALERWALSTPLLLCLGSPPRSPLRLVIFGSGLASGVGVVGREGSLSCWEFLICRMASWSRSKEEMCTRCYTPSQGGSISAIAATKYTVIHAVTEVRRGEGCSQGHFMALHGFLGF